MGENVYNINGFPIDLFDIDKEHSRSVKVSLSGINSLKGALNVHNADVHDFPVNEYFHRHTGVADSFSVASTKGDVSISVTNGTQFAVGDNIHIFGTVFESTFPQITAISTNTLTLDRPLDNAYSIGDSVEVVTFDMSIVGTLLNPVSFRLVPPTGKIWHVVRTLFSMTHDSTGDLGLFGNIQSLKNGVVLRVYRASENQYTTFTIWKSNSDIKDDMYNLDFDVRSGGGGTAGTTGEGSIRVGTGAVPKLNGTDGDFMELLIQDDLTGLVSYKMKGQGHIEGL